MRLFAFALLVTCAVPASAQDMPISHKFGLSTYAASAVLDYHSTYKVLSNGGRENNPAAQWLNNNPAKTVIAGAVVDAVAVPLLYKWLGKNHPQLTTVLLYTASAFRFHLAAANYRELR
jgi:hypothetical protein